MPSRVRVATPDEEREFAEEERRHGKPDGGSVVRVATPEEEKEFGEPGHPGKPRYAGDPNDEQPTDAITPTGTPWDAVKSAANTAALRAGPVIGGVLGAALQAPMNAEALAEDIRKGRPASAMPGQLDAYREVRNDTARDLRASERTMAGKGGSAVGTVLTPVPVKALPASAGVLAKAGQAAKVGGAATAIESLASSPYDLTKLDKEQWKAALSNALARGAVGAGGGGLMGATLATVEPAARSVAETQALRAAGLQAGIKNSIKKDLGLSNMDEARALGRRFLDEDLIPRIGSSEAVAKRAQKLEGKSGQAIGSVLNKADVATMSAPQRGAGQTSAGRPSNVQAPQPGFDFDAFSDAARAPILDPAQTTAVERRHAGKALDFADDLAAQGVDTPGSFVGANRAKSKAWQSARFDDDAPAAAQLYRKSVSAARDNIEEQVRNALGDADADALRSANERFGVSQDALKLAENASTRQASRKGFGMPEILALTTGAGGAGAGHPIAGGALGLAIALGARGFDKYGHSTASRFSDFVANRAAKNTGGVVGAEGAEQLAEYLKLLEEQGR